MNRDELSRFISDSLKTLTDSEILGPENCPEVGYWSWPVLKPDELPKELQANYRMWGHIRWFRSQ